MITEAVEQYADTKWRLNNLYTGIDDQGREFYFRMNDAQEKFFDDMWYFNLILKARQLGMTTLISIIGLDAALFNDNYSVGICAHTREDVEKIFEKKIKHPYDNVPSGLQLGRPADTDSAKKLKFINGSSIEVGTSLRGGTYQLVHISEFGKICAKYPDKAKEIVTGTFETVHPGAILNVESTAEGRAGYFYRYVKEAQQREQQREQQRKALNKLQFKLHFFPWYIEDRNRLDLETVTITKEYHEYFDRLEKELNITLDMEQRAWYVTKAATLQDDMKREHPSTVDEAFEASIEGAYLAKQMKFLRENNRIGKVPHDPAFPVNTGWDFGLNDQMCVWFHQQIGGQHRLIDFMSGTDDDVLYYWREMNKLPYSWGDHNLPHDAGARRMGTARTADENPRTIQQILSDAGMRNIRVVPKVDDKYTAIQETRQFLAKVWIDEANCKEGIDGLDSFRHEWDDKLGTHKNKPLHDWAMDRYDACETLARGTVEKMPGTGSKYKRRGSAMAA